MEVKQTDGSTEYLEPASQDESALVGMLFEKITELYPDWKMFERSDLAMAMFATVKKWGHNLELTSESHSIVELPQNPS